MSKRRREEYQLNPTVWLNVLRKHGMRPTKPGWVHLFTECVEAPSYCLQAKQLVEDYEAAYVAWKLMN